jgi:hypothetical protein
VYHLLKDTARDDGYELGLRGFQGEITGRLAALDVLHRGLVIALSIALLYAAYRLVTRPARDAVVPAEL